MSFKDDQDKMAEVEAVLQQSKEDMVLLLCHYWELLGAKLVLGMENTTNHKLLESEENR